MTGLRKTFAASLALSASLALAPPAHAFGLTSLWSALFGGAGKVNVGDLYANSNRD